MWLRITKSAPAKSALITVGVTAEHRGEVIEIANLFRAKVVDVAKSSVIVEMSGAEEKIEASVEFGPPRLELGAQLLKNRGRDSRSWVDNFDGSLK